MSETNRLRVIPAILRATILLVIAAVACNGTPFDGMTPLIEGTIEVRGMTFMHVFDDVGMRTGETCEHSLVLRFAPDVMVYRNGSRTDTSALVVGQRVTVFGSIDPTKQCPGSGSADGVVLR